MPCSFDHTGAYRRWTLQAVYIVRDSSRTLLFILACVGDGCKSAERSLRDERHQLAL